MLWLTLLGINSSLRSGSASEFTVSFTLLKTSPMEVEPPSKRIASQNQYLRERAVYERLRQVGVAKILGFNVPRFIRADDDLRIIEMTVVTRPFVLDFAGAYLDAPPEFSDEIWAEWETGKREQFDQRWSEVQAVLAALEEWDLYMVDVSPSNIAFRE
jgi:hypothetical protein